MVTRAEDNPFPSVLFEETEAADLAANPASGQRRLIVDPSDHLLYLVDTSGVATAVAGSGLTDPMTSRGDIIIRDASNATARLAKGSADTYLGSDGTDVSYSAVTDAKLSTSDVTTNNATTSKHGFLKKLDNVATHFMDGTGAWSSPVAATGARYPVQTISVASASGTTRAPVFAAAPTNGNILYACTLSESTDAVTSISQTNVTWTLMLAASAGVAPVVELWKGVVSASAGTTATVTWGGTAFHCTVMFEFASTAGTLSTSATRHVTTDATGSHPIPILTPSNVTDLIITAGSTTSNGTTFSAFTGAGLVAVETARTIGVAYGFPGINAAFGNLIGGSSATATGLTASIA